MAARPKQQRIDPRTIDRAVAKKAAEKKAAEKPAAEEKPVDRKTAEKQTSERISAQRAAQLRAAQKTSGRSSGKAPEGGRGRSGNPQGRPTVELHPATLRDWISGARPQTLPLAIAPVAIGTGAASLLMDRPYDHWVRALLCLVIALALQIGVNFANDYSDGIRGTDARRSGPARLVGSGRARPRTVLTVALVFFGIAAAAGVTVSITSGHWWLILIGAVCIAGAWFYTGGSRPYGYAALGEVAVFVFFGLVAVAGTIFVQVDQVSLEAWLGAVAAGLLACAVLMINNIRDLERDAASGKRTLAVLIGATPARVVYVLFLLLPFGILTVFTTLYINTAYVFFALLAAVPAAIIGIWGKTAPEFVTALRLTVLTALLFGLGLGAALAF